MKSHGKKIFPGSNSSNIFFIDNPKNNKHDLNKYINKPHNNINSKQNINNKTIKDNSFNNQNSKMPIKKRVLKKYGVILHTIGVYSVNTKDKFVIDARKEINNIVFSHKGILQMHGFYIDSIEKNISFDIIIDFNIKNREEVYQQIYDEVQEKYKDYKINITLDVDISD